MSKEEQADAERADLVQDYGENLIHLMTTDETLRHIPVVKTLVAVVKGVITIRDTILCRKIEAFLQALSDVPRGQRVEMVERLEADPKYNRRVGLHLVELLDRLDSHRKPAMVGIAFGAYAQGRIDLITLQRLTAAIEQLPAHEFDVVRKVATTLTTGREGLAEIDSESKYAMINAGLAHVESGFGGGGFIVTKTCTVFLQLELDTKTVS
jgi:hypothetical protein